MASNTLQEHRFARVEFFRFKAFERFTLHVRSFNILVGPNNAGKSTILTAFRILSAALRKASARNPEHISFENSYRWGYRIDLDLTSVAEENLFYNYEDSEPATVTFHLSNQSTLTLVFPAIAVCYLFADGPKGPPKNPSSFKRSFNCSIGFVPILGPVEHNEQLFEKEAARLALNNYTAARNFRNIWHHYPEKFEEFRELLKTTWPSMDIEPPGQTFRVGKPILHMFCPEERIPREIFWAGFGFQVWCQMLTHLVQSKDRSLFLIDEPDIYLHAELQRHLVALLRNLGPDIIIATHSTEIITEAEPDEIVLIDKKRRNARRIRTTAELADVFLVLGSSLNPVLTQLAKTRRVVFVEGKDFNIISKFGRKLNYDVIATRSHFAVVPVEGFNPERIKNLKEGMEKTLGAKVRAAAILDRDYRSNEERNFIISECKRACDIIEIHNCKEIENFLLVPEAINRAASRRTSDHSKRTGEISNWTPDSEKILTNFAIQKKSYIFGQCQTRIKQFERKRGSTRSEEDICADAFGKFETNWQDRQKLISMIPGKEALAAINEAFQSEGGVTITPTAIIEAMRSDEVPQEMVALLESLQRFTALDVELD